MLLTASARRDNANSSDKEVRKSKQCQTTLHLKKKKKKSSLMPRNEIGKKKQYNVLRPSTISGRLNVFNKSLRTSGGQVAESAMIGTEGNIWRNRCSF